MSTGRPIRLSSLLGVAFAYILTGAGAAAQDVEQGRRVFQEKCVACHTVGGGDVVGPDLAGVMSRRDHGWLVRWLTAPDRMLAEGDPVANDLLAKYRNVPMPNQGLSAGEVQAVLVYLTAAPGVASAPGTIASPVSPGDAAIGKELFTGTRRFVNHGPACMACHSIAGIGALGGGALGPDLTMAASMFGRAGLASILSGMPFPTMAPIFTRRPLTAEEQRHLGAFMGQAPVPARSPSAIGLLAVLATLGAGLGLGLAHVSWRRRLVGSVRRGLLERGAPGAQRSGPARHHATSQDWRG